MKKKVLFLLIVTIIPFFASCKENASVFPDIEPGFFLDIRANSNSELPDIVLYVETKGDGYMANVTAPDELSSVSVAYEKGSVTLISGNVELPLGEKAGAGLSVVFRAVDYFSLNGLPDEDKQIEIDGYFIEYEHVSDKSTLIFTIDGPDLKRAIILRVPITERNPETNG